MKQFRNITGPGLEHLKAGSDGGAETLPPGYSGDMYESDWEMPSPPPHEVTRTRPPDTDRSNKMSITIIKESSVFQPQSEMPAPVRQIPIAVLGNSLSIFMALTFVLCVLFDLWFPGLAMNAAWAVLLPGFVWISWPSFFLGLVETFAYGWYIALLFGVIYNFMLRRAGRRTAA